MSTKPEYRVAASSGLPSAEQLNELAGEGWELVQVIQDRASRDRMAYAVYLRREVAVN